MIKSFTIRLTLDKLGLPISFERYPAGFMISILFIHFKFWKGRYEDYINHYDDNTVGFHNALFWALNDIHHRIESEFKKEFKAKEDVDYLFGGVSSRLYLDNPEVFSMDFTFYIPVDNPKFKNNKTIKLIRNLRHKERQEEIERLKKVSLWKKIFKKDWKK